MLLLLLLMALLLMLLPFATDATMRYAFRRAAYAFSWRAAAILPGRFAPLRCRHAVFIRRFFADIADAARFAGALPLIARYGAPRR